MKSLLYGFYRQGERSGRGIRRRVTPAGWFLLSGTLVGALSGVDTNWSAHYQLFALLVGLLVLAAFSLLVSPRPRLAVERHCPRFATAGQPLSYSVTMTNTSRRTLRGLRFWELMPDAVPTKHEFIHRQEPGEKDRNLFDRVFVYYRWMWLVDQKCLAIAEESNELTLPRGSKGRMSMSLLPRRRGQLSLRAMQVVTPDCFGFFRRLRKTATRHDSILILPKRYPLPRLDLPGRSPLQLGGQVAMAGFGQSDEFVGLRDYRAGDPLRSVHWRTSARLQRLVVKEFEEESFPRYALALDTQLSQGESDAIFEEAVSVSASFVATIDTRESILDLLFVDGRAYSLTAGGPTASADAGRMLEVLAKVQPSLASDSFSLLAKSIMDRAPQFSACVLVLLNWDEERKELVRRLRQRHVFCFPLVIRPKALDDPSAHFLPLGEIGPALAKLNCRAHA